MGKKNRPTRKQIGNLLTDILKENVVNIVSIEDSATGATFEVSTESKSYILKTSNQELARFEVVHELLSILKKKSVKVPKSITASGDVGKYGFAFFLLVKISGDLLERTANDTWPQLLLDVGEELRKIHSIKIDGFGVIDTERFSSKGVLAGRSRAWYEFLLGYFKARVEDAKKQILRKVKSEASKLSDKQTQQVIEIMNRVDKVQERLKSQRRNLRVEGRLIHGDIHPGNILVKDGRLVGLIDFYKTLVGDPFFDITYFSVMPGGEFYEHLLKGSGLEFSEEKFHLYRLLVSVGKIHTRFIKNDYLHEYPEILDIALKELNR